MRHMHYSCIDWTWVEGQQKIADILFDAVGVCLILLLLGVCVALFVAIYKDLKEDK